MKNQTLLVVALFTLLMLEAPARAAGGKNPAEPTPLPAESAGSANSAAGCGGGHLCTGAKVFRKKQDGEVISGRLMEKLDKQGQRWLVHYEDGSAKNEYYLNILTLAPFCKKLYRKNSLFCVGDAIVFNSGNHMSKKALIVGSNGEEGDDTKWLFELDGDSALQITYDDHFYHATPGTCSPQLCVGDEVYYSRRTDPSYARGVVIGAVEAYDGSHFVHIKFPDMWSQNFSADDTDLALIKRSPEAQNMVEVRKLESENAIDRRVYNELRRKGMSHAEALTSAREAIAQANGPAFTGFTSISLFLTALSKHVYAFDRAYLEETVKALQAAEATKSPIDMRAYAGAMILPYVRHINYPSLRERFLNPAVTAMERHLSDHGAQNLRDLESTRGARLLALRFLAASLRTSMSVASEAQKRESERLLAATGRALSTNASAGNLREIHQEMNRFEAHIKDLAQNPYLTARAAADLALLEFLRGDQY